MNLDLTLPFVLCGTCRASLSALDSSVVTSSSTCGQSSICALSCISASHWFGNGPIRHTYGGTVAGVVCAVLLLLPLVALRGVRSALGGLAAGALAGGISGGAVGLDGGNALSAFFLGADAQQHPASEAAGVEKTPENAADAASTRYKAISNMTKEERNRDAENELQRMGVAQTAYAVLGVAPGASPGAVKKAHTALSLAYHPDRNSAPRAGNVFAAVASAFAILSDAEKRAAYDDALAAGATGASAITAAGGDAGGASAGGPIVRIKSSGMGVAGSAVSGTLGAILGATLGVVSGTLFGMVEGAHSSIIGSYNDSGYTETAAETVRKLCVEAAAKFLAASNASTSGSASASGSTPPPTATTAAAPATAVALKEETTPLFEVTTSGLHYATGDLELCVAINPCPSSSAASSSPSPFITACFLPRPQAGRVPDMPVLLDLTVKPTERVLRKIASCTGSGSTEEREFGLSLATAAAEFTAASRKEGHIAEPVDLWDDPGGGDAGATPGGGGGGGSSDATGMEGGDTFEDAAARLRLAQHGGGGAISTASGLIGKTFGSVGVRIAKQTAGVTLQRLQRLGAVWEARSRGRDEKEPETGDWITGRLRGMNGEVAPPGVDGGGGAINDPDKGWKMGGAENGDQQQQQQQPFFLAWARVSSSLVGEGSEKELWRFLGPLNVSRGACGGGDSPPSPITTIFALPAQFLTQALGETSGGGGATEQLKLGVLVQITVALR